MKENSNNMKMIVEIYCQMPKKIEAIKRTELDKLLLKNQSKFLLIQLGRSKPRSIYRASRN